MSALRGFVRRLRALVRPGEADRELEAELAMHLDLETEVNMAKGMDPTEARRLARVSFGGLDAVREAHRDGRGLRWLRDAASDVRYALRTLRRNPALAATALLTLALGIGATTAIFTAVNAVLIRPLPFADPGRLVAVWEQNPDRGWYQAQAAGANYLDWREQVEAFEDVAAYPSWTTEMTLTGDGPPLLLRGAVVTGNFFEVLGVPPALGRGFTDQETWKTGESVAIISHRLWVDRFGASPALVGTSVPLDRVPTRIVGVMPAEFDFPFRGTDVWKPTAMDPANRQQVWFRRAHYLNVVARLRPETSIEQADASLQTVVRRLEQDYPETNTHMGAGITPLHEFITGTTRGPLLVLLGSVALLLIIACANVGNLLLVQAAGRDRETAVRIALGAGRLRLVRQGIAASLVLSVLGGLGGLAVGWAGTRVLLALQPEGMLPVTGVGIDWRVLSTVGLISLAGGVLVGIAPALWGAGRPPAQGLQAGGRAGGLSARGRRFSEGLIIAEVALALTLTIGAGLLTRSLLQLQRVEPGFDPTGVQATSFSIPSSAYADGPAVLGFLRRLQEGGRAIPGVQASAVVSQLPLTGRPWSSDFTVQGRESGSGGTEVVHRAISPGYLEVMRVPLVRGRAFLETDDAESEPVVLINQALADRYFPGQDPVGLRIAFDKVPDSTSTWRTIVGVVGSEHQSGLSVDPEPEFLAPLAQDWRRGVTLILRIDGDPTRTAPAIRDLVRELDPALAILQSQSMVSVRRVSVARPRFMMALLLAFAGVGVVLAMVGVYGVMAQLARQRTREMCIRMALGAPSGQIGWIVVRHGLRLTLIGIVLGSGLAVVASRALRSLLFEVAAVDPATYLLVPLLLAATALVATWIPASRASRSDPATALRAE